MSDLLYDDFGNFVGFCHTHGGKRVLIQGEEGCQHSYCVELRGLTFSAPAVGMNTGRVARHEKALDEYRTARKNGLQPESTAPGSVARLEREMESQERALKRLSERGHSVDDLKTHEGVRR